MPGVADVRYDRQWMDRLAVAAAALRWAGYGLSAILVLAAALTITIVVRLATYARRDEIEIMELVGAPLAFIRGPFICEGIVQGALGAGLAVIALRAVFGVARGSLDGVARLAGAESAVFLAPATMALVLAGGALVGCVAGLVGVSRTRA
jgi:cell division transport system permease protein